MKIETKEVLTLTTEEKKAINTTYLLMIEIIEQIKDPDIYNAVKQTCDVKRVTELALANSCPGAFTNRQYLIHNLFTNKIAKIY